MSTKHKTISAPHHGGILKRHKGSAATTERTSLDKWLQSGQRVNQTPQNIKADETTGIKLTPGAGAARTVALPSTLPVGSNHTASALPSLFTAASVKEDLSSHEIRKPSAKIQKLQHSKFHNPQQRKVVTVLPSSSPKRISTSVLLPAIQHADALRKAITRPPWPIMTFKELLSADDNDNSVRGATAAAVGSTHDEGQNQAVTKSNQSDHSSVKKQPAGENVARIPVDVSDDTDDSASDSVEVLSVRARFSGDGLGETDESEVDVAPAMYDLLDDSDSDVEVIPSPKAVICVDDDDDSDDDSDVEVVPSTSFNLAANRRQATTGSTRPTSRLNSGGRLAQAARSTSDLRTPSARFSLFRESDDESEDESNRYSALCRPSNRGNGHNERRVDARHGLTNDSADGATDANATTNIIATTPTPAVYDLEKFMEMWESAELNQDLSTEELEGSSGIRGANNKVSAKDSTGQARAQYGRIMPEATQKVLETYLQVDATRDVVVDIGCGIGNFVLQAAYVLCCEARGIEVDEHRCFVATQMFQLDLKTQHDKLHLERDNIAYAKGTAEIRKGCLEDENQRDFLTVPSVPGGTIKAFCNNYNDVFGYKSSNSKKKYHLDHSIAGLFALFPPGSILVTLHPLPLLCQRKEIQSIRQRHGLASGDASCASFYEVDEFDLGQANKVVSWGGGVHGIPIYRYRRVSQGTPGEKAVFLCCNAKCEKAQRGEPIPATQEVIDDGVKILVMNCCDCKQDARPLRGKKTKGAN